MTAGTTSPPEPDFFEVLPTPELLSDPRWMLVERILQTPPFQKSSNLHRLLTYLAEHSISGETEALSERYIGTAVFGKPIGYSPSEDSAVRVHVRQLRLRLHEYFALAGKTETLLVDLPKGSYVLEFHETAAQPQRNLPPLRAEALPVDKDRPAEHKTVASGKSAWLAFAGAICVALICAAGWYRSAHAAQEATQLPWILTGVIHPGERTALIVSDSNSMVRLLGDKEMTLEQYLQPGYRQSLIPQHVDENFGRLLHYISDSQLTSFADLAAAMTLSKLAGPQAESLEIESARDLNQRDLEHGNFVFIGSPASNPWVSLFENHLNFEVREDGIGGKMYFLNKAPQPGEKVQYEGLPRTGSAGDEYASIALLPSPSGPGNVLILQGLRQEGTEALSILLSDPGNRRKLAEALGISDAAHTSPYFEALIRARAVAGAPDSIDIVATRIIHT